MCDMWQIYPLTIAWSKTCNHAENIGRQVGSSLAAWLLPAQAYVRKLLGCPVLAGTVLLDPYPVLLSGTLRRKRHVPDPRTGIQILYRPICLKSFFRSLTQNRGILNSLLSYFTPDADPADHLFVKCYDVVESFHWLRGKGIQRLEHYTRYIGKWDFTSQEQLNRYLVRGVEDY